MGDDFFGGSGGFNSGGSFIEHEVYDECTKGHNYSGNPNKPDKKVLTLEEELALVPNAPDEALYELKKREYSLEIVNAIFSGAFIMLFPFCIMLSIISVYDKTDSMSVFVTFLFVSICLIAMGLISYTIYLMIRTNKLKLKKLDKNYASYISDNNKK